MGWLGSFHVSFPASLAPIALDGSRYTGANPLAGRWTPGTLTNQIHGRKRWRPPVCLCWFEGWVGSKGRQGKTTGRLSVVFAWFLRPLSFLGEGGPSPAVDTPCEKVERGNGPFRRVHVHMSPPDRGPVVFLRGKSQGLAVPSRSGSLGFELFLVGLVVVST